MIKTKNAVLLDIPKTSKKLFGGNLCIDFGYTLGSISMHF